MIQRMLDLGLRQMFGGARQGRPGLTGLGAGLALLAWLRRRRPPRRELLWATNLAEGESVRIGFRRGEAAVEDDLGDA